MNNIYLNLISYFIDRMGYDVDQDDLYIEFNSHPDFPSFQSITDTLDHFSIESVAATIPKVHFDQLDQPVLVNVFVHGKQQLAIAENLGNGLIKVSQGREKEKQFSLKTDEFLNIWDGNLIALEKGKSNKKRKVNKKTALLILLIILALYPEIGVGKDIIHLLFSTLTILGLFLSYLIFQASIAPKSRISKFCSLGKSTDCESVINSTSSKLFGALSLSDLSTVYFLSLYTALIVKVDFTALAWVSVIVLPVIVYSIYQQGIVIKKWCPLCLAISLILSIQFLLILPTLDLAKWPDMALSTSNFITILLITALTWAILKPFLLEHKSTIELRKDLKTFKRNYHLFIPYFQSLPQLDTQIPEIDIHYGGNLHAPIKILGITNPLCKHCQETNSMFERLRQRYPDDVCIDLRFYVPQKSLNDPRVLVSCGMLKAFMEEDQSTFQSLINTWYAQGNVKPWLKTVGLEKAEDRYLMILNEHTKWCKTNGISVTPIILVNNRIFPLFYEPTDLEYMVEALTEELKTNMAEELQPS